MLISKSARRVPNRARLHNPPLKAKYIVACDTAKQAIWIMKFVTNVQLVPDMDQKLPLYCDNNGAIAQVKELRSHKKSKQTEKHYHIIKEIIRKGIVVVYKIA